MAEGAIVKSSIVTPQDDLAGCSIQSVWVDVLDAGAVDDTDNATASITNPASQGADTDHHAVEVSGKGTGVLFRLKYDDGDTPSADAVIEAFGKDQNGVFTRLYTNGGATEVTLTTASETTDGTWKYTNVNPFIDAFDAVGCETVHARVKTAYAVSGGNAALAIVQAKVIN